ncbi:MAG: caspase family protein [Piscinibacter sp.]|nr:caspase family protein [Piscinibacter sp.]
MQNLPPIRSSWRLLYAGLLGLLLALAAPAAPAAGRVALVIGNAAYPGAPLRNPVNDALAMADTLKQLGFEVSTLTDAGRGAMEQAIVRFSQRLDAETTALFYYAGHGVQSNGRNYLLAVDAQVDSEAGLRFAGVDVSALLEEIERAGSRVNVVILDACRNNPFEVRTRGGGKGLAAIDAARGTLIAYATAPGSVAHDGGGRHGLYTAELLRALQAPGLKVEDVFKRVRVAVSERSGGQQVPWESSSLTGDFVFRDAPAVAATDAPVATGAADLERRLWDSARELDTPAAYAAYLERYPDGVFAGMARLRAGGPASADLPASAPAVRAAARCDATGRWQQNVPSTNCQSVMSFRPRGDGTYDYSEDGCGLSSGVARYVGSRLLIDWSVGIVLCRGYTELDFDAACQRASGEVVMPANILLCSGRHPVTLQRLPDAPPAR